MKFSFTELLDAYEKAQKIFDIEGQAACIVAMIQDNNIESDDRNGKSAKEFMLLHFAVVFLAVMECIEHHRGEQAEFYLKLMPEENYLKPNMLPSYQYWLGRAFYEQDRWEEAARAFSKRLKDQPDDELANFFLGNCFVRMGEPMRAVMAYQRAITINGKFRKAVNNLEAVLYSMNQPFFLDTGNRIQVSEIIWQLTGNDIIPYVRGENDAFAIPIFINSRDRVEPLRRLVGWLQRAGYKNIHILDNKSTYPPLLSYYDEIVKQGVNVWPLKVNFGHKALWESNMLNILQIDTPYVYTDSDVVPDEDCPHDILAVMANILARRLYLKKVGLSLHIDDITYYNSDFIRNVEGGMRHIHINDGYFQSTDTTFSLYRNWHHYSLRESIRTTGNLMGRHIPWYYDFDNLPEDEFITWSTPMRRQLRHIYGKKDEEVYLLIYRN